MNDVEIAREVSGILGITEERATLLVTTTHRLYATRMNARFTNLRVAERLKRTNPFLLRIRGARTVREWATFQVQSSIYASEEEAVGHVLEAIAKACHPESREPRFPADIDYEVSSGEGNHVTGYQVKMSWDCMPMSSRKNLSNTIRKVRESYGTEGVKFTGIFAPCYGKSVTTSPAGQDYVSLSSREFWAQVGNGDPDFDIKVGTVCALLFSEFREGFNRVTVPDLIERLTQAGTPLIGEANGDLDYTKLFRRINR